ncbi:MAG: DNA primase, partial [Cyanobacteria bacterium P01_C01_bin.73]
LYLDEKNQRDILRSPLVIRAAIAAMEKHLCEKRYRHFLNLWQATDCTASPALHIHYQKQVYAEKQRIEALEKQRHTHFEDLLNLPWVGEFYSNLEPVYGR